MLNFAFRFFFHNRKRTFQAVLSLSIALWVYIATTLLVQAYASNVSGMATIIKPSNKLIVIEEGKSLSESKIDTEIYEKLKEIQVEYPTIEIIVPQVYIAISISWDNNNFQSHLRLANLTLLHQYESYNYFYTFHNPEKNEVIVGQQLANMMGIGYGSKITISNSKIGLMFQANVINVLATNREEDIEILSSLESISDLFNISYYSFFELKLTDYRQSSKIIERIENAIPSVSVLEEKQTQKFIVYATDDVIRTISLLQIFFFILMLISITYTMYTLVKESEKELIILRSLGATKIYIVKLFMFQGLLVGLFSALISLSLGYLGVEGIVGAVSTLFNLPYIAISPSSSLIISIFIFSLSLSLASCIYPSYVASKLKIAKEELF